MAVLFKSGSGARIVTCLIMSAVLVASLAMIMPRSVSAEAGPYQVDGHVTDSAGRPMAGIPVVVVMKDGATTIDTQSTTTDGDGFYTVDVGHDLYQTGFTVTSTATANSIQVSDSATVDGGYPFLTIDLQFPFEIPQFGSILGFVAAAGLVGVVAVVFLARKSK
jgi:hypothetical protein